MADVTELSLKNYPAIRAARARAAAAAAAVDLARTSYLPKADLMWQENRATRNNIFGLLLPQSTLPSISGPVLGTTSYAGAWGSAGGVLLSWEPLDFGQRHTNVELARALQNRADAGVEVTELDVEAAAADAFLVSLAADKAILVAQADVGRLEVFAKTVHVLVDNELRPGADGSRADAELAAARTRLILAQQASEISRADLAEAIGRAGSRVEASPDSLSELPKDLKPSRLKPESHPLVRAEAAAVQAVQARQRALDRSYYPRLNLQFAWCSRG